MDGTLEKTGRRAHQNGRSGVGTGTTSLLMIFTVLCFATLAMLSLSTAISNQRIQQRGLDGGMSLSAAKGKAAAMVAELDAGLLALRKEGADGYEEAAAALALEKGWTQSEEGTIALVLPIDEKNQLVTELALHGPGEKARYTVVRQVSMLADGWTAEGEGQLWLG